MKINVSDRHENPKDSQVIIVISGESKGIKEELARILSDFDNYGKPIQGSRWTGEAETSVITPTWTGRKY